MQTNNRRITGNTTISSNNSLLNRTNDLMEPGKFNYGTKLTGNRGFFTGTIGTMMANQNDTKQTELSEISNGTGSHTTITIKPKDKTYTAVLPNMNKV